jgi:phenylacetic acid degradation operon negative regulatory protein
MVRDFNCLYAHPRIAIAALFCTTGANPIPSMPIASAVSTLLDQFHARRPVRAWSLIITIYGDAIVPRGGRLWLGSLLDIMALFRIDSGHVRTAMSRLTSDGWLKREKAGRNSYYRLTRQAEGRFNAATQRIYFPHTPAFDGRLRVALIGPGCNRTKARPALLKAGFTALTPTTYVAVADPSPPLPAIDGLFLVNADPADDMHALAAAAWKLDALATAYRAFVARFTPLERALNKTAKVPAADALVARVLLIHEFRRIVLRDPGLPAALLPPDWPGTAARQHAARLYRRLIADSETYLDAEAQDREGPLPPPENGFSARFA